MTGADPLGDYFASNAPTPQREQREEEEEQEQPWTPGRHFGDEANSLVDSDHPMVLGGERVAPHTFDLDIVAVRHCRFPCDVPWHRH